MLEDFFKTFFMAVSLLALGVALAFAIPGMKRSLKSDVAPYSGAHPDMEVEYEPLNTLPPTYDNE